MQEGPNDDVARPFLFGSSRRQAGLDLRAESECLIVNKMDHRVALDASVFASIERTAHIYKLKKLPNEAK